MHGTCTGIILCRSALNFKLSVLKINDDIKTNIYIGKFYTTCTVLVIK